MMTFQLCLALYAMVQQPLDSCSAAICLVTSQPYEIVHSIKASRFQSGRKRLFVRGKALVILYSGPALHGAHDA